MNIFGVEIRADALAVARLKSSPLGLKVEGYEVFKGDNLKARVEGLRIHISGLGIKSPRISLALPRSVTISGVIDIPAPDLSSLGGILRFEIEKHMPFKPEETYWGFETVGRKEKVFSVLFAAVRKNTVDKIVEEFTEAGLVPDSVGFWQASIINALARWKNTALSAGTAIVGIDAGTATLDVFSDFVPVYSKTISAVRLREDGWTGAVKRELGAFLRTARAPKLDECVVLSEEVSEDSLLAEFAKDLNLPAGLLHFKGLRVPPDAASALGAAISALGKGRVNIDLLASSTEAGKADRGYLKTLALSAAVVLLLMLTGATYFVKDWVTLYRLESSVATARLEKEKVEGLAVDLKSADERIKALEGIKGRNSPGALEVMRELTVMLTAGTWLTGFEYNGGVVFIEGFSDRASAELLKMERSGLMKDVEFAGPVTKGKGGKEHFRIKFSVRDYNELKESGKGVR